MIDKKKIRMIDIDTEYEKFKHKDAYMDFSKFSFDNKHERYGYYHFINTRRYEKLASNQGDIHGFDGMLIKDDKVYFYEAKYSKNATVNALMHRAYETNTTPSKTRIAPMENSQELIKYKYKTTPRSEISMLTNLLNSVKNGTKMNIDNDRMVLSLGNHDGNITKFTENKLLEFSDVLVVKYEE